MAYSRFSCSDWQIYHTTQKVESIEDEILRIETIEKSKEFSFKELKDPNIKTILSTFFEKDEEDIDEALESVQFFIEDMLEKYGE